MKKAVIAASVATLMSASVQADVLGLYVGGQYWDNSATGLFGEAGQQENFNLEGQGQSSFFIALEHPVPVLPNVKIASNVLDTTGQTTLENDFEFAGEVFPAGTNVGTTFDVSYIDYVFYYEVFSNDLWAFDFGLTARDIDGDIAVAASSIGQLPVMVEADTEISEIIPMLYVSTKIGLPFTGFNVFAEGNLISYDDSTMYDYQIGVGYELLDNLAVDLDLQLGYRAVNLELSDIDDLYTDLKFDGAFAGVVVHF